jgi:acetylglutamate kinase
MLVVKIGGRAQNDPRLIPELAAYAERAPGALCVVHGGGDEISTLQRKLVGEPRFHGGRRVTSADELAVVRMVLSASVNKRLVAELITAGVMAVGISGEDAGLLLARPMNGGELGAVGEPFAVQPDVLVTLVRAGFLPVISPLARDATGGGGLNVNGDDAAAAIAVALGASELLLIADVPGVLDDGVVIRELGPEHVEVLRESGKATGGMHAKLDAAGRALRGGVASVRIGDLACIHDPHAGTRILHTQSTART